MSELVTSEEYKAKTGAVSLSDALKRATDSAYGDTSRASSHAASESDAGATPAEPGPAADKQRTVSTDEARDVPASPDRTLREPPAAPDAARARTEPARTKPYRVFATEEEWQAHLSQEAEKHKSRVRAEQSEWDALRRERQQLTQALTAANEEKAALTITLERLKREGLDAARSELLQAAATRGVGEGDIYRVLETLDPGRFQGEELQRLNAWRQQEAARQRDAEQASAAQQAEFAQREGQIASDTQLEHERAVMRVIAAAAKVQVPLDETEATALINTVSSDDPVARDLFQDWQESAQQGDVAKAKRKAETSFRHLVSLAQAEITRRAVARTDQERPALTAYDRRTVGGAASGGVASGGKEVPGVGRYPFATDREALSTLDAALAKQKQAVRQWRELT